MGGGREGGKGRGRGWGRVSEGGREGRGWGRVSEGGREGRGWGRVSEGGREGRVGLDPGGCEPPPPTPFRPKFYINTPSPSPYFKFLDPAGPEGDGGA